MGKIKPRILGMEDVEKKQKDEQKRKAGEKKLVKKQDKKVAVDEKTVEKKEEVLLQPEKKTVKKAGSGEKAVKKTQLRGKKYQKAKKMIDKTKLLVIDEAIELIKRVKFAGFDESVELHLNVESSGIKGEVELPHSTGKTVNVRIVDDKLLEEIAAGKFDFDVLITHPSYMAKLAKFARVLGPKGLMPNPKAGTVSPQPEETAKKFMKGTLRYKTEAKFPLMHQMIGKISFKTQDLTDNAKAFLLSVGVPKIKSAYIKTTMGPSVRLNLEKL